MYTVQPPWPRSSTCSNAVSNSNSSGTCERKACHLGHAVALVCGWCFQCCALFSATTCVTHAAAVLTVSNRSKLEKRGWWTTATTVMPILAMSDMHLQQSQTQWLGTADVSKPHYRHSSPQQRAPGHCTYAEPSNTQQHRSQQHLLMHRKVCDVDVDPHSARLARTRRRRWMRLSQGRRSVHPETAAMVLPQAPGRC